MHASLDYYLQPTGEMAAMTTLMIVTFFAVPA